MLTVRSFSRWLQRQVKDHLRVFRRQARRALRNPALFMAYARYNRAVAQRDWTVAAQRLKPLCEQAISKGDTRLVTELAHAAERLDEHELASTWAHVNARLMGHQRPTDWSGEDLSDATLVISFRESDKQGISIGLEMTGYVAEAARRCAHCVLVVEQRLVPLFARSLPGVEVVAYPFPTTPRPGTRLVTANAVILKALLGSRPERIRELTRPMLADAESTRQMRQAYLQGRDLPLVGIAWWSSHVGKDLPPIELWAGLVRSVEAVFVVVQYGELPGDLAALASAAGPGRLIVDDSVDQLRDMDRFAAQLSALDCIVTISNSGAHLAGALQVPTLLIRDDLFRRAWSVVTDSTPWYPNTKIVGKDGRPWPGVFEQVKRQLDQSLSIQA